MNDSFYFTIAAPGNAEFKERGSKFLAYSFPIMSTSDFKLSLDLVKKEHSKATHHCFGYRLGLDGNSFRVSDDGEPSGTAGKPILGQIDSKQLTNTLIIVVRYFGGTLLGVPGLINAYKNSAALVLQTTTIIQKSVEIIYSLQFDYTTMNDVMNIIKQQQVTIIEKELNLFCRLVIGIPKNRLDETVYHLNEIRGVELVKQ
ncbi:MAG: YigZ family protein [Chitinophagaceae bacterium]|nr:YigZ family protein [Chitinophagaceae bacterium]